ncbi:putative transcription factor GRAS family [Dioscorea sansibarensis]
MTMEEGPEPNLAPHHHLLDWLEDSASFIPSIPSFFDEPYTEIDLNPYEWWNHDHDDENQQQSTQTPASSTAIATPSITTTSIIATANQTTVPKSGYTTKKRKQQEEQSTRSQQSKRRNNTDNEEGGAENEEGGGEVQRKPGRKVQTKGSGSGSGNNGAKDVRWAEQLLNPCAAAIHAMNLSRVQHLLYVLNELASPSGDANHRLAAHGLRALKHHLSSIGLAAAIPCGNLDSSGCGSPAPCFATTEPRLFRSALIKFHEVSPWFTVPNSLANASILQTITQENRPNSLHIVDIGVSHGIQWPTLLEALTRRPGGAPSIIRLTVAGSAAPPRPFSTSPPDYDFPSHLLRYAKSLGLNLHITQTETLSSITRSPGEIFVVSSQFRASNTLLLRSIRDLDPDLVVLTELDDGGGGGGEGFAEEFGRRTGVLWRFLESTSAAFKGRECAERTVVEGEAARMLDGGVGEGREEWEGRMKTLGFMELAFGEEALDAGRALLRKYDGNWEMRIATGVGGGAAGVLVSWKGQSVSLCSLWKLAGTTERR